jgi:hypothetical protein
VKLKSLPAGKLESKVLEDRLRRRSLGFDEYEVTKKMKKQNSGDLHKRQSVGRP